MKKIVYIFLGFVFLVLGMLGIVLPLLPTTPFLLLTAYFFVQSSPRLYNWLINHRVFGVYIYNYITFRAIPLRGKILALLLLWVTIPFSIIIINLTVVTIVLLFIAVGVSIHLIKLKTLKKDEIQQYNKNITVKKEI